MKSYIFRNMKLKTLFSSPCNELTRMKNLRQVVCLITGGASGLGKGSAIRLVQNGARVVIADLASSDGEKVARELGENCVFAPTDVTSEEQVKATLNLTGKKFGAVNAVVNSAGIMIKEKILDNGEIHSLESFAETLKVNLTGLFNVTRLAAACMATNIPDTEGERGVIINVSSVHAFEGQSGRVAYAASKGGINAMILPLARDLAEHGIRVNAIAPGIFLTPMFTQSRPTKKQQDEVRRKIVFPSKIGNPDEFAHIVQAIIENPMINAEVIRIDAATRLT